MRVSFYFERSCLEQRPRAALKPQEPRSSGPWTPGAPAPAARSSRVAELWSWSRGKWQAAGAIFVVGKVPLTLHPPLRPLSHNANPRDGAPQDIKEKEEKFIHLPWRGQCGGPLLAARALPLRCAASAMLSSALAVPNCGAQGAPAV
jgi:hypothetical protein